MTINYWAVSGLLICLASAALVIWGLCWVVCVMFGGTLC